MGLFNARYEKEGPGISKDAPRKKTFIVFFETFFRNFWKFIPVNVVFSVLCLPLLTQGIAAAGLTNVARNTARDKHSFGLADFFETIKKNFRQSLLVGIINTLITALMLFALWFYHSSYMETQSVISLLGFAVSVSVALIFIMMNFFIYTLMITFNYSIKTLYVNSFKFVIINLKKNILCLIILAVVLACFVAFFFILPQMLIFEILFAMVTLPSFLFLLIQYCTFPAIKKYVIDPYYAEHPDADIEKRRNLGLEVEDEDEDGSDFNDDRILPEES